MYASWLWNLKKLWRSLRNLGADDRKPSRRQRRFPKLESRQFFRGWFTSSRDVNATSGFNSSSELQTHINDYSVISSWESSEFVSLNTKVSLGIITTGNHSE